MSNDETPLPQMIAQQRERLRNEFANRTSPDCKDWREVIGITKTTGQPVESPQDFEKWYGENVSGHFADEHCGIYHRAHAVFGEDVKAAWDAAMAIRSKGVCQFCGRHCKCAYSPKREIVAPPPEMGMKMADVRVGMKMKSLYGGPEITVTKLTDKGFKYSHPPYHLGARIWQTTGGEHYGYNGYSHYTEIEGQS